MMDALPRDKERMVNILARAFDENLSVNHLVLQDGKRTLRIRRLMEYAIEECTDFGRVLISVDRTACALVLFPDKKRLTFRSLWRDLRLVFKVMGLGNLSKVMKKENLVKMMHQAIGGDGKLYYLWFIGVHPNFQGRGAGGRLLAEILEDSVSMNRLCVLETSTEKNLPFYERAGLVRYQTLDVGYPLFCYKMQ